MKKRRVPRDETPAGREHAEFVERAKLGRPVVDEALCFVCQEKLPTHTVARGQESFKVCAGCADLVTSENRTRNRIKQSIFQSDGRAIFEQTLGANLMPTKVDVKREEN